MTTIKFTAGILLATFFACTQHAAKHKVAPEAAALSNKIITMANDLDNPDSCRQALLYLDSATAIDSNCYLCYYNKLMFLYALKKFEKAAETINECIRMRPFAHDLYMTGGILYEKTGDTIAAGKYFRKSLEISAPVLDTMNAAGMDYALLLTNKAINLVMLGDAKAGNALLKHIADTHTEPEAKAMAAAFMNKTKAELVEMMTSNPNRR